MTSLLWLCAIELATSWLYVPLYATLTPSLYTITALWNVDLFVVGFLLFIRYGCPKITWTSLLCRKWVKLVWVALALILPSEIPDIDRYYLGCLLLISGLDSAVMTIGIHSIWRNFTGRLGWRQCDKYLRVSQMILASWILCIVSGVLPPYTLLFETHVHNQSWIYTNWTDLMQSETLFWPVQIGVGQVCAGIFLYLSNQVEHAMDVATREYLTGECLPLSTPKWVGHIQMWTSLLACVLCGTSAWKTLVGVDRLDTVFAQLVYPLAVILCMVTIVSTLVWLGRDQRT